MKRKLSYLALIGLILAHAGALLAAEPFRVAFPSLATVFAPSWVAADKVICKKHGLDLDLIFPAAGRVRFRL